MHALGASVTVGATSAGVGHVGGVSRCASPWSCPVCAPTIGERRAGELDMAFKAWIAQGGSIYFVTATLSHQWGDDLGELLEMLQGSWSRTFRFGSGVTPPWYAGQARAVEVTYGRNGWHPHIHAAIFLEPGWDHDELVPELVELGRDWAESVERFGGRTMVPGPGWDVRKVEDAAELSSYMTKVEGGWGAGLELARIDLKAGKGATPSALLSAGVDGDSRAARLFRMYEVATAGKRRIVTSPGLMKRCEVEQVSDEEAAEADLEDEMVVVASIPAPDWCKLLRAGFATRLLSDVEKLASGASSGWAWPPDWLVIRP